MTSRNRQGSYFYYWRLRHFIYRTLAPVLLPRLMVSAAFLFPLVNQRF